MVIGLSLAAALAFACAAVLQQHSAVAQPAELNMRLGLIIKLAQRPLWLAGIGASVVGTLLQLLALWHGPLVAVQPLLVCGLLFALVINAIWLQRRRPTRHELVAAAAVCSGLSLFLVATDPRSGFGSASATGWIVALSALGAVAFLLAITSLAWQGPLRAGLLASAGGIINGVSAAFVKGIARQFAANLRHGFGQALLHLVTGWELYAFAITLLAVVLLVQSAFQVGPIGWSLPALTAFNPVTSVLLGSAVLGERIDLSPLALAGAVIGLAMVVVAVFGLSSSDLLGRAAFGQISRQPLLADEAAVGVVDPLLD